jgi:hypothetical protein
MKYETPTITKVDSAAAVVRGAKGQPFSGDVIDPTRPPYLHTQNAYEADE